MADKKASGIQYDDFVSAIRSDPAQSEPLIMVAGYVGKSDTDGNVRIYPDASLSHWYEAAQDDVVHSRPLADSPLGGSNVWLKGTAQITPGVASVPKPEPKEGEEGDAEAEAAPQVGADTGVFNPLTTIHPTLWTQIGCVNAHYEPPLLTLIGCLAAQGIATQGGCIHPTIWTQIGCSTQAGCIQTVACLPPQGIATQGGCIHPTIWTQIGCSTQAGCIQTANCLPPQGLEAQAQQISRPGCVQTGICISQPGCLPPPTLGCPVLSVPGCLPPRTLDCPILSVPGCLPPTHMYGCPRTSTCPPQTHLLGCPSTSTCPPTHMLGCPATRTCPPTHMLGCPNTSTCPPTNMPGCPNTRTCTPGGGYEQVQTVIRCHTLGFTCTYVGCPPQGYGAEAQHISLPGCIHTGTCLLSHNCPPPPTNMPGCPNTSTCTPGGGYGAEAQHISLPGCIHTGTCEQGGGSTAATLCTRYGCVTQHPGCGPEAIPLTSATLCTQISCPPTHMLGCPSTSTCPPGNTAATVCTQMLGCPNTRTCPPTHMLGCPSTSTCPPQGGLPPTYICGEAQPQRTIATVCTRYDCAPTQAIGCLPTVSDVCLPMTMGGCG